MSFILTIDDGPTAHAIGKIGYLNKLGIKSIWFCLGENLERNPEAAVMALKTGHILGNHSFSHPHFSEISLDNARSEIERTEKLLDDVYRQSGISRPAKLFRFPYGDQGQNKAGIISEDPGRVRRKRDLQAMLTRFDVTAPHTQQYAYRPPFINAPDDMDWLWSYDIQEWAINYDDPAYKLTYEQVIQNLDQYLLKYDDGKDQIILTHDHVETTGMFATLIDTFVDAGCLFRLPAL